MTVDIINDFTRHFLKKNYEYVRYAEKEWIE